MQGKGNFRIDLINNSTGLKTGSYPIVSATEVTRRLALDRVGEWNFPISVADPALGDIEGSDFDVYWNWNNSAHYLGRCSYLTHAIQAGGDGSIVRVKAAGSLHDLTRQTVLARSFDGATDDVNDVLSEIVPLRSGWALGDVDTITTAAPLDFWYESIFDAVALLAKTFNYHFREGSTTKTLDFGALGASGGVLAVGGERELPPGIHSNAALCHITDLSVEYESERVVNQLIPFGGAVGVATIDLSETTSTQPGYAVQNAVLPSGDNYYYIQDATSITTYGLTSRRFVRSDLRPIVNSQANREYAANILYEAALATLLNLKDRQTVYSLTVTGLVPGQLDVGDKIAVLFRGWVNTPSGAQVWLDVDSDSQAGQGKEFYVLEMDDTFGDGVVTRLTINENAVHAETVEDLLANTIREFENSQIHVQPTVSRWTVGPYVKRIDTSVDAEFSFNLGDETLDLVYAKMKLVGEPLKSSVIAAASETINLSSTDSGGGSTSGASSSSSSGSGQHQHSIAVVSPQAGNDVYHDGSTLRSNAAVSLSTGYDTPSAHSHNIEHTHSTPNHSHGITMPSHTHDMTYGIYEDATRPNSLTVKVNGSTVASGVTLSAPDYDYELDITDDILDAASLQADHTITIEAGSGQGEIVFQIQILGVIQPIKIN